MMDPAYRGYKSDLEGLNAYIKSENTFADFCTDSVYENGDNKLSQACVDIDKTFGEAMIIPWNKNDGLLPFTQNLSYLLHQDELRLEFQAAGQRAASIQSVLQQYDFTKCEAPNDYECVEISTGDNALNLLFSLKP